VRLMLKNKAALVFCKSKVKKRFQGEERSQEREKQQFMKSSLLDQNVLY